MLERLRKALGAPDHPTAARAAPRDRAVLPLAQQALLAVIDPTTGKRWNENARYVVVACLLLELTSQRRISISGTGGSAQFTVLDSAPLGDPELDSALQGLDAGGVGRALARNVRLLPDDDRVATRMVADGLLVEETRRTLGVLPSRRLHPTPAARREDVVARVRSALLGETVPDERTALLVAALVLGAPAKLFVPRYRVKDANRRRDEIVSGLGEQEQAVVSAVRAARERNDSGYASNV